MGHRGCRLAVTYPEIASHADQGCHQGCAINVQDKHPDWNIVPEIMIPLVGEVKELKYVKNIVVETADELIKEAGSRPALQGRHHDRDPARRSDRGRDRQGSRVLLLRHQRPDPDDVRLLAVTMRASSWAPTTTRRSTRTIPSPSSTRPALAKLMEMAVKLGRKTRPDLKLRYLRRARRRSVLHRVLPQGRPELRSLLPLPRSDRSPGCCSGCYQGKQVITVLSERLLFLCRGRFFLFRKKERSKEKSILSVYRYAILVLTF